MSLVIKNTTKQPHWLDNGVTIEPGEQISIVQLTPRMNDLLDQGVLSLGQPTPEDLKADVAAIKPFRTGDPAIDG